MKKLVLALALCGLYAIADAQPGHTKQVQLSSFEMQASAALGQFTPQQLSTIAYKQLIHWYPVKVPVTVLGGLVANHIYPNPYLGLNNMRIPDASDEFNKQYNLEQYSFLPGEPNPWKKPYWYRTTFTVPAADKGRTFQLIFKGINYRAAVWVNGQQVTTSKQMAGMFAEYQLDVSKQIKAGQTNALAVEIYPLDYPGLPAKEQLEALGPFYENGGPTGDIGKNVTMLCSVGWDWIPPVRDRNMGIWQPVYLRTTDAVTIAHPQLKTELPNLPDTSLARLSVSLTLANHGQTVQNGRLKMTISPANFSGAAPVQISKPVQVAAGKTQQVTWAAAQISELNIKNPHLWWPVNYGNANLYRIRLQYETANGTVADDTTFLYGLRTVSSKAIETNGSLRRDFYVNGRRIHLVGGAWVPDMMVARDSARYDYEVHLCRNANVNLLRIWGGGVTPPDAFFNAADRYGLLVWSDFWITGDTQGEFKGSPDWPLEADVFSRNVVSTICRIRNHPSLLVWTGGNEGHARKELYDVMRNSIIDLDGTRPFIPSSSGFAKLPAGWKGSWPDDLPGGVYSGGPYQWRDPHDYYQLADNDKGWVFKDETGIPSLPPYNTLAKNVTDTVWDKKLPFPFNNTWGYHDAATGAGRYDLYNQQMVARYGEAKTLRQFADKMQLMNYTGYQGIFEAAGHKLTQTGGVMLWKLNAAFPSVIWQIYDWYLQPNAGYYAMQNACEPLHIQLNLNDSTVAVVNRRHQATPSLTAEADVYDLDSRVIYHQSAAVQLTDESVKELIPLRQTLSVGKALSVVMLKLKDASGRIISRNTYWLAPGNDCKSLQQMPNAQLQTRITGTSKDQDTATWQVQISNPGKQLAFFVRPQLMQGNEEVMPAYWSAGYFTLAPGESVKISVSAPLGKLGKGKEMAVVVSGWNVPSTQVAVKVF